MIDRIIQLSLKNRLLLLVLGAMVMAGGYFSYTQLPVDAFPDVSPNLVQVFTITEGLAPEEIEQYITYPVEAAMNGLPGISKIRSVSNFGLSVVNVYFKDDVDIYFARRLVDERLQEAREQIPEGFGEPAMGPISTGMGLILFYYLEDETGTYSLEELRSIQDWLVKFHLQTVPGVTEVLGIGGYEKQFHINVHPEGLLRYDVSLSELIETIRANNLNVGAQFIERDEEELIVRSVGLAYTIDDLRNIVVKSEDGTPIFLSQIADIEIGGAIRRGVQTYNGVREVVSGMVVKLFGANSSTVIESVESKMEEINKLLPKGIKIIPYYEQKTLVAACVQTVTKALLEGMVLVIIILMAFLGGFRPSLVAAISIPFSVLFAFIGMKQFGISANLMSFGGLAIAIGMLVDGSVVMVENTERLLHCAEPSESRLHVVSRACIEVGRPIAFAILIIIVVFLPLFTLSGVEGKTFKPLAYTVALAMLGSLLFALLIAPVLSSLLMRRPKKGRGSSDGNEKGLIRWLLIPYRPVLRFLIARRILALILAVMIIVVGGVIYPQLGSEFTPTLQEGTLVLRLTMAPSIALTESTRITLIVERRLMEIGDITGVVTRIGRGEVGAHTDPVNSAEMYILLKPRDEWASASTQEELQDHIRDQIGNIPGVLTNFTQPIQMTVDELLEGVRAELAIKVFGDDLDSLKAKADEIAQIVSEVPGAADVQPDQVSGTPQLLMRIDRQAIARYGINVADVQEVVQAAVGGEIAGQIFEGVKRFDIRVRFDKSHRDTPEAIGQILVQSPDGAWIPLHELASIEQIVGPRQITRENNQRFITIQCNVTGRDITSFVKDAQEAIDTGVDLPAGYFTIWGGQFRLQQEANKRLAVVIPITLLFVFFLLFTSFNSLKNSLLILLNLPLALVGGIVGLWIT
ncbi:MAG: efflux RND transporter permease subunit, partial [Candidatus Zixiibacteriota bacterium]